MARFGWSDGAAVLSLIVAACGGGGSAPEPTAAEVAVPAAGATPAGATPTQPIEANGQLGTVPILTGALAPDQIDDTWTDRLTTGDEFDRRLARALVEASGLPESTDVDVDATVDQLLATAAAEVDAVWRARGIDPEAARTALAGPPPAIAPLRRVAPGVGGVMALVTSIMSAFEPVFSQTPDSGTGHLVGDVSIDASIPTAGGSITLTLDQTAHIDLAYCPSAAGVAEGVVTVDAILSAVGRADDQPVDLRSSATVSIAIEVRSGPSAELSSVDGRLTGTIVSAAADGETAHVDADGVGISLPFGPDGQPRPEGARGHGAVSGTESTIDAMSEVLLKVSTMVSYLHGQGALAYWSAGRCVRLETDEPLADLTGSESAEIEVRAVHEIDGAAVIGSLAATPSAGTIEPLEADAPAIFTITVAPGDSQASAVVDFRSRRGVANTDLALDARGLRVELGDAISLTGAKCDGPVGDWHLTIEGSVDEQGLVVVFTGALDLTVTADLSATYHIDFRGDAEGLPAEISAALSFTGDGSAVFVDDTEAPRIDLLDGELATTAEGSGPGMSIGGIVTTGPSGQASIPVLRSACGS